MFLANFLNVNNPNQTTARRENEQASLNYAHYPAIALICLFALLWPNMFGMAKNITAFVSADMALGTSMCMCMCR